MLVMTDAMRALVGQEGDIVKMRSQAARDGLRSLRLSGAENRERADDDGRSAKSSAAIYYLDSCRIARVKPSSVIGNILPPAIWRITEID